MPIPELILASSSPRRKVLLSLGGLPFDVQPADINEDVHEGEEARAYVSRLAKEKAEVIGQASRGRDAIVIAADTTVVLEGQILGKPTDGVEAKAMLTAQRGRKHIVYSGLTVQRTTDGQILSDLAATEVPMRNYSDAEIDAYVASGDPLDKAGAYAIQHSGFHPVEKMTGCFANVVGLPLCHLQRTLKKWDVHFATDLPAACQQHLKYECPVTEKILNWEL